MQLKGFFLFLLYNELYNIEQPMFRNKYLYTKKFCEIYGTLSLKSWSMHIALGKNTSDIQLKCENLFSI